MSGRRGRERHRAEARGEHAQQQRTNIDMTTHGRTPRRCAWAGARLRVAVPRGQRGGLARGGAAGRRADRQREAHQQPAARHLHCWPARRSPGLGRRCGPPRGPAVREAHEQTLAGVAASRKHREQRHRGHHAKKTVPAQSAARAEDESDRHSKRYGNPQAGFETEAHGHRSLDGWTGRVHPAMAHDRSATMIRRGACR